MVGTSLVAAPPANGDGDGDGDGYGYGNGNGYGDGNGSGDGNGDGYGYGYCDGYGYGYCDGYGYGYGNGNGYGDGDGDGSGSGDGSGDGYGYCDGYGDGYGDGDGYGYWQALLGSYLDSPIVQDATADGSTVHLALWKSDAQGRSRNGGNRGLNYGTVRAPGLVEEVKGPLQLCTERALHASVAPEQWEGERWWVVALYEPIVWDGNKLGSLKRLTVAEIGAGVVEQ